MADRREVLTWETFGVAVRELALDVARAFEPEVVLSVARGGLIVGGALGYALGVKSTVTTNVEYYTGVDARLDTPKVLSAPDLDDLDGARVLLADDVADTGHTLRTVLELVAGRAAEVRTAVLYSKPQSVVRPDFSWRDTAAWVTFPWSDREPVLAQVTAQVTAQGPAYSAASRS